MKARKASGGAGRQAPPRPVLAANLSPQLIEILEESEEPHAAGGGAKAAGIRAVKIPSGASREARDREIVLARSLGLTVVLHFWGQPLSVGSESLMDRLDLEDIAGAVQASGTPSLQSHLFITPEEARGVASPDRQSRRERQALLDRVTANVAGLMSWLGAGACPELGESDFLIENGIWWGTAVRPTRPGSLRCVVEPDFIREVVESTGCGFLLDVSHAYIASFYLGLSFEDYIDGLPLGAVREVHINAPAWVHGVLRDRHLPVGTDDLRRLRAVLARTRPERVTYEYGTMDPANAWRSRREDLERGLGLIADLL